MLHRMMDILCCPVCRSELELRSFEERRVNKEGPFANCLHYCDYCSLILSSANVNFAYSHCPECYLVDIQTGLLMCASDHQFPIERSIPRFNPDALQGGRTKVTFDMEWSAFQLKEKIYGHSQEEELQDLFARTSVDGNFLQGKIVLDAGCGIGRLTQSVGQYAREIVGMDFSESTDEARLRNQTTANVHIVQGDIMHPPFRGDSFDLVFAKGVLHYVPDVRGAMESLASVVKPGGSLSVTINPKMSSAFETFNRDLRKITLRLPVNIVHLFSLALVPFLDLAWLWSGLQRRRIDWSERAHMIFNWLSSEYLNTSSDGQMRQWLVDLGFDRIRLSEIPVGITGRKSTCL